MNESLDSQFAAPLRNVSSSGDGDDESLNVCSDGYQNKKTLIVFSKIEVFKMVRPAEASQSAMIPSSRAATTSRVSTSGISQQVPRKTGLQPARDQFGGGIRRPVSADNPGLGRGLAAPSGASPNRMTPPQVNLRHPSFDQIISTLGNNPIDEGIIWDGIESVEYQIEHTSTYQRAFSDDFRRNLGQMSQYQVERAVSGAIERRYPDMSTKHREMLRDHVVGSMKDTVMYGTAWDMRDQAMGMLSTAESQLREVAGNSERLEMLGRVIHRLENGSPADQRAATQMLDGLGLESSDLGNTSTMSRAISERASEIHSQRRQLNNLAPQNLLSTICQMPGAADALRQQYVPRPNSFLAEGMHEAISQGESANSRSAWARSGAAIVAGVGIGILTAGAGATAAVGFFAGAGTSAVMGLPGLADTVTAVQRAQAYESAGIVDDQGTENATRTRNVAAGVYVAGIVIPNGVASAFSNTARSVGSGTALSLVAEVVGNSDLSHEGLTGLQEQLNGMSASASNAYGAAFDDSFSRAGIPAGPRPALLTAFLLEDGASVLTQGPRAAKQRLTQFLTGH